MIPYFEQPALQLGPVTVYAFGIAVAVAVLVGLTVAEHRFDRSGLDSRIGARLAFWMLSGGLLGAHLFSVLLYFPEKVAADPWLLLRLWEDSAGLPRPGALRVPFPGPGGGPGVSALEPTRPSTRILHGRLRGALPSGPLRARHASSQRCTVRRVDPRPVGGGPDPGCAPLRGRSKAEPAPRGYWGRGRRHGLCLLGGVGSKQPARATSTASEAPTVVLLRHDQVLRET